MFCSKCGTQLPDDAKFCNSCGNSIGEKPAKKAVEPFKTPSKYEVVTLAMAFVAFITCFLSWYRMSELPISLPGMMGLSFEFSAFFGIAKILLIITAVSFIGYAASFCLDLTGCGIPVMSIRCLAPVVVFGTYDLAIIFSFIAAVSDETCAPTTAWFFYVAFAIIGTIAVLFRKKAESLVK